MQCRRPSALDHHASAGDNPEQAWGFDVHVSDVAVELVSGSPASIARTQGRPPPLPRTVAACLPAVIGSVQSFLMLLGGVRSSVVVLPAAMGALVTLMITGFVLPWSDGGRRQRTILRVDRVARTLHIACSGATIPLDDVRGVQLLHGIVDIRTGNYELRQLVVLAADKAQPATWRRYLAHVDFCPLLEDHARAIMSFGAATEPAMAAETYRIRGWRTPESYVFSPGAVVRRRRSDEPTQPQAAEPEPLGDGQTLDAWRAAGFNAFDSIPERVSLSAAAPRCRRCDYSLEGLSDPATCPECGADFVANPTLRA